MSEFAESAPGLTPETGGMAEMVPEDMTGGAVVMEPDPAVTGFDQVGVTDPIVRALKRHGFVTPTPIQAETIPLILTGRDMIGQAETGSGKTLACSIPAAQMCDPALKEIQVLVLAPTRELAVQYLNEMALVAEDIGLTPFAVYGGFDKSIQRAKFATEVQMLVATPGRLIDLIYNDYLPLNHVKLLIIDEGDEMLDMGFIEDLDFIAQCLVQQHQTLLFSATMPPPIRKLADKFLHNPLHIKLNAGQVTPKTLDHAYITVPGRDKTAMLLKLLRTEDITQAIIFCNARTRVQELFDKLKREVRDFDYLHGGLEQDLRMRIMDRFRHGKLKYVVTTDVMARGLDFVNVSHIIHFDLPHEAESYVHRSGRTARKGKRGIAIALVTPGDSGRFAEIKRIADIVPFPFKPEVYSAGAVAGNALGDDRCGRRPGGHDRQRRSAQRGHGRSGGRQEEKSRGAGTATGSTQGAAGRPAGGSRRRGGRGRGSRPQGAGPQPGGSGQ